MDRLATICSNVAGGFAAVDSPCLVVISSPGHPESAKTIPSQSVEPTMTPEDAMNEIAELVDVEKSKLQVHVFAMCGGMDGNQMKDSKPESLN